MTLRAFGAAALLIMLSAFGAGAQDVGTTASSVYRDFTVPGNAASGAYNPPKADIRSLWNSQGAINASGATYFTPRSPTYGGKGDCSTDDTNAIASAATAAATAKGYVLIDRCYRVASTATYGANFAFVNNGYLSVDALRTVTLSADIQAPRTAQIFAGSGSVVASAASFVSVAWWGALAASDPAPAFRAAIGSNREYFVPPALYTFKSYTLGFIGATTPGAGLVSTVAFFNGMSRFNVKAYGARFQMDPSAGAVTGACSCMFFLNNNADFSWKGGEYIGNKSNITSGSATNVALVNHNAQRFEIGDMYLSGNWGSQYNLSGGSGITGEFNIDGVYRNIPMDAVGIALDMAFLRNVTFDNVQATGANFAGTTTGTTPWGRAGLSLIYDPAGVGYNTTGQTITGSDNVKVVNSRFQNFYYTNLLGDGTVLHFSNDYFVGGNVNLPNFGFYFATDGSLKAGNVTVTDSVITGFNYGAYWSTAGMSGAFAGFTFANDAVQGMAFAGFETDDTSGTAITNLMIGANNRYFANATNITGNVQKNTSPSSFTRNGIALTATAFANLPACASGLEGRDAAVTDSSTATFNATITGGGSNHVKAYCNGTNWTVH